MIQIESTITIVDATGSAISSIDLTSSISSWNNLSLNSGASQGFTSAQGNPFILGVSEIGDGTTFCDDVNYYISTDVSGTGGTLPNTYVITVSGTSINHITFKFDQLNNVYPTSVIVDSGTASEQTIYNDDYTLSIVGLTSASSHTFTITTLNAVGKQLVISGVYCGVSISIDKNNLVEYSGTTLSSSDNKKPCWGLISNNYVIKFNDREEEVLDYSQLNILGGNPIVVNIYDTLTDNSDVIAEGLTTDFTYDQESKSVTVGFSDILVSLQNITYSGINYDGYSKTGAQIYEILRTATPSVFAIPTISSLDSTTRSFLQSSYVQKFYIDECSFWCAWDTFCKAFFCKMYQDRDGNIKVIYGI